MKILIKQSVFAVTGLILAGMIVSCEKNATHSVLPDFSGDIKIDRALIGQGQKVTASYTIPVGGENIESDKMHWNCDDYQILSPIVEKDGVSTINFIADYELGKHKIEFVRQYVNIELAEAVSKSKVGEFTIVPCDVLTSFWKDSKAVVLATADEKFENATADVLEAYTVNTLTGAKTEIHQYFFTGDQLNQVSRTLLENARASKAVGYANARTLLLEKQGYTRLSFETVSVATGTKTAIDMSKLNDGFYTIPISTDVENGHIELRSTLQNDKTAVTLSYKMRQGILLNILTYTPR